MAGVESGHQQAAEGFWRGCDTVLDAAGEFVAAWQELLSARRRRERELENQSQALRQARVAGKQTAPCLRGPRQSTAMAGHVPVGKVTLAGAWPRTVAALPELWRLDEGFADGYRSGTGQAGEIGSFDVDGYLSPVIRWLTWTADELVAGRRRGTGGPGWPRAGWGSHAGSALASANARSGARQHR